MITGGVSPAVSYGKKGMVNTMLYIINITLSVLEGYTADQAEIDPNDLGKHTYHIQANSESAAQEAALDQFHLDIPIGVLDWGKIEVDTQPAPEEIQKLKDQWLADPNWDLEETPGFESVRKSLLAFRKSKEAIWWAALQGRMQNHAEAIGCSGNQKLAEYLARLEGRVIDLEKGRQH